MPNEVTRATEGSFGHQPPELLISNTPWKINMEPENDGLEDDFPFQLGDF